MKKKQEKKKDEDTKKEEEEEENKIGKKRKSKQKNRKRKRKGKSKIIEQNLTHGQRIELFADIEPKVAFYLAQKTSISIPLRANNTVNHSNSSKKFKFEV